jgi:hypothetical protein
MIIPPIGGMSPDCSSLPFSWPAAKAAVGAWKAKNLSKQSSKISFSVADFARVAARVLLTTCLSLYPEIARPRAASMLSETEREPPRPAGRR